MDFKRNQVEEAVWRLMSRDRLGRDPQVIFRTRIKRLLELDRAALPGEAAGMAFAAAPPPGRGNEARFTAFDAFCLAIGLQLLNAGFKQREIVDLLRHIRRDLAAAWDRLQRSPAAPRQRIAAADRPEAPAHLENGLPLADTDVYLVLDRVETTEVFPGDAAGNPPGEPLVLAPLLLHGGAQLAATLRERAFGFPGHYVVELSVMAALLQGFLEDAEPRRRGPPQVAA